MIYPLILFCLCVSEFYYALLSCEGIQSIIVIMLGACIYIILFGIILRPRYSIFGYLLLWIFIPKSLYYIPNLVRIDNTGGITLFLFIEIVAMLAICVSVLTRKISLQNLLVPTVIKKFLCLCLVLFLISWINSIYRVIGYNMPFNHKGFLLLHGLIFIYGFIAWIKEFKDIEKVLFIFVLAGIELVLEFYYFVYLELSIPLAHSIFHPSGRFNSLIYSDYQAVSLICMVSMGATLYFVYSRKMYRLLVLVPLLFLPVIMSFERVTIFLMLFIIIFFAVQISYFARRTKILIILSMVTVVIIVSMGSAYGSISILYKLGARPDFLELNSMRLTLEARLGSILRGFDVFLFTFPFGTGIGNVNHFMGATIVPSYFPSFTGLSETSSFYEKISSGVHPTGSHNLYVNIIAENGFLGVMMVGYILYFVVSSFTLFKRRIRKLKKKYSKDTFVVQICSYSILFCFGAYYIVQHVPVLYFLIFLFLYLIVLLPKMEGQPMRLLHKGLLPRLH